MQIYISLIKFPNIYKHFIYLKDSQCGMALSEEIKIEAIKRKLKFKEVHIAYYQRFGEKKIKKFQDGIINLIYLFQLKFRR